MKNSRNNTIINFIIVLMLSGLVIITFSFNATTVFSINNENVVYEGDRKSNNITLMFNVYSGSNELKEIVDVLNKYDIKTTFFVGGIWAEKNIDLLKNIILNGHEIGNHGYLHLDHNTLDYNQNYDEIYTCHNLVKVYTGYNMNLFAPPSGAYNNATIKSAQSLGYTTVMWSRDTIDWRDHDANLIYSRATKNVRGGELILMHPTKQTAEALIMILEYYKLNNFNVVTLTQNILTE